MRDSWAPIYEGNDATCEHTASFIAKYRQYLAHGPTIQVPELEVRLVMKALQCMSDSAGGADGWLPSELRHAPRSAVEALVPFLRMIEGGRPWPEALTVAKSVYIGKHVDATVEALKFRGLLITSAIYRMWAKMRLHHVAPAMQHLLTDDMFAGRSSRGAADAWHTMSLALERATAAKQPLVVAAFDLFKAFC